MDKKITLFVTKTQTHYATQTERVVQLGYTMYNIVYVWGPIV